MVFFISVLTFSDHVTSIALLLQNCPVFSQPY